jgi:hypothetical protein
VTVFNDLKDNQQSFISEQQQQQQQQQEQNSGNDKRTSSSVNSGGFKLPAVISTSTTATSTSFSASTSFSTSASATTTTSDAPRVNGINTAMKTRAVTATSTSAWEKATKNVPAAMAAVRKLVCSNYYYH